MENRAYTASVSVMIVGPCPSTRRLIADAVRGEVRVSEVGSYAAAERAIATAPPAVVIAASDTAEEEQMLAFAGRAKVKWPFIEVIAASRDRSEKCLLQALRFRLSDYLKLPAPLAEIAEAVRACCRYPEASMGEVEPGEGIVGTGPAIATLREGLVRVAKSECNVLITGETGTGKELAAEVIHRRSSRRAKPFVCVNCAAVPDLLFESELFGYERGAFTGANAAVEGKVRNADGGSILLDEIGDLSSYAQAKILRLLESKEVQRLGGRHACIVNVRFIAATNQNLETLMNQGLFRKDLFFRLNVARLHLPPLRDRREDIPKLVDHFAQIFSRQCGHRILGFTTQALDRLCAYDWPGNVRELRNVVEAIFVNRPYPFVDVEHLPATVVPGSPHQSDTGDAQKALRMTNWNKVEAAKKLNWSRMTLYRKIAKYGIQSPAPKDMAASSDTAH
jgi:DNA-binding NtrC family response regulator